jgi:hypothetical protein
MCFEEIDLAEFHHSLDGLLQRKSLEMKKFNDLLTNCENIEICRSNCRNFGRIYSRVFVFNQAWSFECD